ncbi:S-layer-like protein [Thermus composti]|uniref:PEGA domain-containing protein n=1 Tax=Thermus composti TaxID=532059 RepID=A0ABV6Q015_9DEIN|nr:PEGA domain-containing protein [Thermus composti]GGN03664.1 S-layer-like protein [Thermus composti]
MRKLLWMLLGLGTALAQQISPQGIIVNPVPTDLKVRVWVDKDPGKRGDALYRIGEPIYIYVNVNQDAYVYLFNINADGKIDPILPNPYERDNFLRAGETRRFPPEGARYRYTITGPEGEDRVLAVASRRPLSLGEILDVERGEVRVRGAEGLARALSIVVEPLPDRDWVTDVARYYVGRLPAPPPATATLNVNSRPQGAEVYLDGRLQGRTPLTLGVNPGRHEVELRLAGYQPYRVTVNPRPGERVQVYAQLVPEPRQGTLSVASTPPGAEVYVDGALRGRTPLSLRLPEGRYRLELRLEGYEPYRAEVRVPSGETVRVSARLVPLPRRGTLQLDSRPQGAEVYLDGRFLGRTPLREEVEAGRHELRLLAPGYAEYRAQVEVRPRESLRLFVELVPVRAVLELYLNVEARVFLDGEEVGVARGGYLRLEAPLGEHELTLVAKGYRTLVQTVRLSGNQVLRLTLSPL